MTISHKDNPLLFDYNIEALPLSWASSYKYLGITINDKLTWEIHVQNIVKKNKLNFGFYVGN